MRQVWRPSVTVAAVIERGGRFLLVEEEVDGRRVLNQPAGHLDPDESLVAACRREVLEETAHHFAPRALVGIYRWHSPDTGATFIRFAFAADIVAHDATRPLDVGILRVLWLTYDQLEAQRAKHRSPLVLRCVDDYRGGSRRPLEHITEM